MNNIKQNKKVLIILFFLVALSLVIFIFLYKNNDNNSNEIYEKGKLNTEISLLEDESLFWSVQKIINDFYLLVTRNKNQEVYNLLSDTYREEHNLTNKNAAELLNENYTSTSFIANKVFYNKNSITTYYFVNGCFYDVPVEGNVNYKKNVNFLIIVDETNYNYMINPLDNSLDIESFAYNYSLSKMMINTEAKFEKQAITQDYKIEFYINYFMKILVFDSERAYDMLNSDAKKKYPTFNDFQENITNIYNNLFDSYIMLDTEKNSDYTRYIIKRNSLDSIIIDEYNIMDFKINFNYDETATN